MAAPIPGVVDMIDQSLLSRNLAAGYQMGLAGRQQRVAEEQMAEQQKRQKVEDAYRAADMLTKMDLPEETSTKLFQTHIIPTLNASYGMNIPTDTQWQPTMKKYLKQIATIAQSADIADADKPAMIKAAVMEAAAKGKDISSAAKPLLADIDEKLDIEAQYGMLPRTPSITQGMVTAPPSGSYEPTPQTMGLAERYKMPEQNVEAQPLAAVAPISKEMLSRLPASMRQKIVEAQRPDLFGGEKKKADSPYSKIDPKDYTTESLKAFAASGNVADLVPREKEAKEKEKKPWELSKKEQDMIIDFERRKSEATRQPTDKRSVEQADDISAFNAQYPVSMMGERVEGAPSFPLFQRFRRDSNMKGKYLGKATDKGVEVFDSNGQLIGHYK